MTTGMIRYLNAFKTVTSRGDRLDELRIVNGSHTGNGQRDILWTWGWDSAPYFFGHNPLFYSIMTKISQKYGRAKRVSFVS